MYLLALATLDVYFLTPPRPNDLEPSCQACIYVFGLTVEAIRRVVDEEQSTIIVGLKEYDFSPGS